DIDNREQSLENSEVKAEEAPKPKPAFKPKFKRPDSGENT
ncbi:hypothetical protein LV89_04810, partial [Arcicella aurantiaca]